MTSGLPVGWLFFTQWPNWFGFSGLIENGLGASSSCEWTKIAVTDLLVHIDYFNSNQTEDLCTGFGKINPIKISTIAPALLSLWGWKGRKSQLTIPGMHLHFSRTVPTTFQATVCAKQQPFCHNLRIRSYEPMAFQWEPNSKAPRARKFELTPLHLYVSQIEAMRAQD